MGFDTIRHLTLRLSAFCVAYIGLALLGSVLTFGSGREPAMWPPSGLLVAFLLTSERRLWPALFSLAMLLEFGARVWLTDASAPFELICAASLMIASALAAQSLRPRNARFRLVNVTDTLAFFASAAILAPALGAAICVGAAMLFQHDAMATFALRWASQAVGVLCFAPAVMVFAQRRPVWRQLEASNWVEVAAMLFVTTAVGRTVFDGLFPFTYILLPTLLWASIRLEMIGAASFIVALSVLTITHSMLGRGMFADPQFDLAQRQWLAQLYLLVMGLSALIVAAITAGRHRALRALQAANADLEQRVVERTSALQNSEERLRMALDAAKMEAFEFSPRTEEVRRVGGVMPRDAPLDDHAIARDFFSRLHPDDRKTLEDAIASATPGRPDYTVEYRFRAPNGEWRWITDRAKMTFDARGAPLRVFGVLIDNTERKRADDALRDSETRFASFMDHLPGLAWIKTIDGRYVYANEAAERAFQRARDQLYSKTDEELFESETAAQFLRHDAEALASDAGVVTVETLQQNDGVTHHSLVSKFPIRDGAGQLTAVGGVAIDITERVIAEQKLRDATERLREADRRKDEFLAMLAHELRNPLAPIRNGLNIMRLSGESNEKSVRLRAMMERQLDHLVRLVDDLMEVARISSGKINLKKQRADLVAIIRESIDMSRDAIDANGLDLIVTLPPEEMIVDADPVRLTQIFANILNNAAKYTERGGRVEIELAKCSGAEACVRVSDTGAGIAPDMLPRIFELFAQIDRTLTHARGGLGIGLALVKNLVEMHGGSITAESEGEGRGSCFTVRLPLLATRSVETRAADDAEARAARV